MYKYLPDDDVIVMKTLITVAKLNGANLFMSNGSGETTIYNSSSVFLKDIDGGVEEFGITFFDDYGKRLGTFCIVLGNGDYITIADYYINDWTEKIDKLVTEKIESKQWFE